MFVHIKYCILVVCIVCIIFCFEFLPNRYFDNELFLVVFFKLDLVGNASVLIRLSDGRRDEELPLAGTTNFSQVQVYIAFAHCKASFNHCKASTL